MPNLKFLGVCLHELFDNGGHKIDVTFLSALTAHHQLAEWEVGRYSIEIPTSRNSKYSAIMVTIVCEIPDVFRDFCGIPYPNYSYS